jgi:autotransporter-associated beta strand protein
MKPSKFLQSFLLAAGSSLLAISSASAQSGTWLGNGLDWNDTAAWSSGTIATGSANTANFTGVDLTSDVSMALGADRTIGNITFTDAIASSHNLTLTGNTLTLAGGTNRTINVTQSDRNLTIGSILAGTAGFTKTGQGTLTLTGSNSITGNTVMSAGRLVLDYATNDNRKLSNNGTLTIGGGTIVLKGGSATENVTGITLSGNAGTFFVREGTSSAKINLNTLGAGGFSAVSFSHDSMATTDRTNTGGILGGWYTVGNRFAANATNAADGDIVGYTGATAFTGANGSNTGNFDLSGSLTQTSSQNFNTLRIVSTADNQTLALGANRIFINNSQFGGVQPGGGGGALMYAGGANGNYTISGSLTDGIRWATQNGQAGLINIFSGTLTVGVGIGSGSASISKTGEGTLVFSGGNVSSGDFRIYQGVVRLRISSFGTITNTGFVQNGAALELANNISIAKLLNITGTGVANGGALRNFANSNTYSGAITIGTGGARINSDTGTLTLTGGVVTAGNNVTFGGAGNNTVSTAAISGTGGLVKDGVGTTTLSATNSYTGATNVNAGALAVAGTGAINTTSAINVAAGGTLRYNSSTALTVAPTLAGSGTSNRAVLGGTGPINATVTLNNLGDVLSPGNSPGIQTFGATQTWASFSYDWEVNDFTGTTAGTAFDQIGVTGGLTLSGGSGSYILNVLGLTAGDVAGLTPNFSEINRSWTILTTTTGITDFDSANWTINTAGFSSPDAGTWALNESSGNLVLSYTAIPEPSITLLGGLGFLVLLRRRRA